MPDPSAFHTPGSHRSARCDVIITQRNTRVVSLTCEARSSMQESQQGKPIDANARAAQRVGVRAGEHGWQAAAGKGLERGGASHLFHEPPQAQVAPGGAFRVMRVVWHHQAVRGCDAAPGVALPNGLHVNELCQLCLQELPGAHEAVRLTHEPRAGLHRRAR